MRNVVHTIGLVYLSAFCQGQDYGLAMPEPEVEKVMVTTYPLDADPVVLLITSTNQPQRTKANPSEVIPFPYTDGLGLPRFERMSSADGLVESIYHALHIDQMVYLWVAGRATENGETIFNLLRHNSFNLKKWPAWVN